MSDNINAMNFKQLKNEVQLLRDELAIMKRKYEDIIYNLDTDNFSQRIVKQGKDMYTKIEQNAEGISLQAEKIGENTENLAELKITAEEIQSEVFEENEDGTKTSRITQTANLISSEVKKLTDKDTELSTQIEQTNNQISLTATEVKKYAEDYVTDQLANGEYVTNATFKSQFDIHADGIYSTVEANYNDLSGDISSLYSYTSSIEQTADNISTRVGKVEKGQFGGYTLFSQSADTFKFDGKYMLINSAIKLTDNAGNHSFSIFHNEGDGIRGTYIGASGNNLTDPLFLGSSTQKVYLYEIGDDNLIATRGWVLENAGSGGTATAVFG